jgi:hypothetical protein
MIKHIGGRCPRLIAALEAELGPERSVFLCMHKDTEHVAMTYEPHFAKFSVGHWGAIDGRNDWETYDTAVVFGLPYRDQTWANNTFFALQGAQDDSWLKSPTWRDYSNVRKVMEQRNLSVAIIQAINRVRCRRVVDPEGRSLPADIYVVLPKDKSGDGILDDILVDMPGLKVTPWAFDMDGPKVRRPRAGTSHVALIAFMGNRLAGTTSMSAIQRELGLNARAGRWRPGFPVEGDHRFRWMTTTCSGRWRPGQQGCGWA